jgi:hypothetical protein
MSARVLRVVIALVAVIAYGAIGEAKELRMVRLIGRVVACEIRDVSKTVEVKNPRLHLTLAVESTDGGAGPAAGSEVELIGSGKLATSCVPVGQRVSVKAQLQSPPVPSTLYELTAL